MIPQAEYITIDRLYRSWCAFRFDVGQRYGWPRGTVYYYGLYSVKGVWVESDCTTFGAWVDLHVNTGKYRVY